MAFSFFLLSLTLYIYIKETVTPHGHSFFYYSFILLWFSLQSQRLWMKLQQINILLLAGHIFHILNPLVIVQTNRIYFFKSQF